jgi:hypothetical protein
MTDFISVTFHIGEAKMALRVELTRDQLTSAIDKELASIKRALTGAKPQFRELYEKELAALTVGRNTITEVK